MNKVTITGAVVGALIVAAPATASHNFDDVPSSHPHHAGVDWVKTNGITAGCDANSYCPADPVTRGQMATFLHRYDQQHDHEHTHDTTSASGTTVKQHVVSIYTDGVAHCPEGTFVVGGGFMSSSQADHRVTTSQPVTRKQGFHVEGWAVEVDYGSSTSGVTTTAVCLEVTSP